MKAIKGINKKIWIPIIAVILVIGMAFGGMGIVSAAGYNEALEAARAYVPESAEFIASEEDGDEYEFRFHDAAAAEKYEIEVDKDSKSVKKIKTQLDDDTGAEKATLTEEEAKQVVTEKYSTAEITAIYLVHDDGGYLYVANFEADDCYGEMEIHAGTGAVLESSVKLGTPIVIPNANATDSTGYLTLSEVEEIALAKVPGATVTDIDFDGKDGSYVYQVELYLDGVEHELVIDAESGEELSYRTEENDWGEYGQWNLTENIDATSLIGADRAREIALQKAGTEDASVTEFELDVDDGQVSYDGEVRDSQYEYDFKINAYTGEVIKWQKEAIRQSAGSAGSASSGSSGSTGGNTSGDSTGGGTSSGNTNQTNNGSTGTGSSASGNTDAGTSEIGIEKAKSIALGKAQGNNAEIIKIELDRDDGKLYYEGEMRDSQYEYDFEIDAYTGTVVKWETEALRGSSSGGASNSSSGSTSNAGSANSTDYIGVEAAKSIVLGKAEGSGAVIIEISLDRDDGRTLYEGEMRDSQYEYDFEIDAYTGVVVQWSKEGLDWDD